MMSKTVIAVTSAIAVSLYGCGGGDNPSPNPDSGDDDNGGGADIASPCAESEEACVKHLNEVYNGFDENNDNSPLGVSVRGRGHFDPDGQWYFCTGKCFQGQPDCYVPASLINHKIMKTNENKVQMVMDYPVLVILHSEMSQTKYVKCAWQYDGAAFQRSNGGCGEGAQAAHSCDDPLSAYQDKCPDDPEKWADENCPTTMKVWCGTEQREYPATCFWKGPAWTSPVHPNAEPSFDFSDAADHDELREMMKHRIVSQSNGTTLDGIPLTEYWNEITMDGRIIDHFYKQDPSLVVAAFGYIKGAPQADKNARMFQEDVLNKTKKKIPVVALDTEWVIGSGNGPFSIDAPAVTTV